MVGVGDRREVEGVTYFTKPSFWETFRKVSNAGSLPEMNPTGHLVPASTSPARESIINRPLCSQSLAG